MTLIIMAFQRMQMQPLYCYSGRLEDKKLLSFVVPAIEWFHTFIEEGTILSDKVEDNKCDTISYSREDLKLGQVIDIRGYISKPEMRMLCWEAGLLSPTVFALFIYNLIIVVNICTKHDMHRYLKLAVLVLGTVVYTLSAYWWLDVALNPKKEKASSWIEKYLLKNGEKTKDLKIASASFYIALGLTYIITFILIIIQNFRRSSAAVQTETKAD